MKIGITAQLLTIVCCIMYSSSIAHARVADYQKHPASAGSEMETTKINRTISELDTGNIEGKKGMSVPAGRGRIYSVSGIGYGFTSGETNVLLQPKFSTNLGFDISLGKGDFFVYPSVDFLIFRYDQQITDPNYLYTSQRSRASFTIFTLAFGYRKSFGNVSIYPFAGIGGGLVSEPRISVNESNLEAVLNKKKSKTLSAKGGLGLDYRIGQFVIFTEANVLHNFDSLQERKINVFPVYLGLKSNLSSVFTGKKTR